jgi:RimJ/RimL family protein N-acetyltransferase
MKNIFYFETECLILRDFQNTDADDLFEIDSNPEVHKYLGNNPVKHIDQIREVINSVQMQYQQNGIGRWAVIEKSSGKFIGWSGLKFIQDEKNNHINFYDVGYRLHPDSWGKGYATESGRAALKFGFEVLGLTEVWGTCHEENIASKKSLEKCGLRFVDQILYKNEIVCDRLKITREEWEAINKL